MEMIEGKIKEFILTNFLFTSDDECLADDISFLEKGIIDSTGVLEIVGFLEETFSIKVEDNDINPDNLDSVQRIVAYVKKKRVSSPV
jgi:acyl carrier protein